MKNRDSNRKRKKKLLIGITGGIGAGKSAVATFYRDLGYPVFSADEIAREVVLPGTPALGEIEKLFGASCIRPDGTLDRAFIRKRISEDSELRLKLEAITHPRIQARTQQLAQEAFEKGADLVFYEAPLLFEAKSDKKMDKVICVYADDDRRIERVLLRDGSDRAVAEKLLKSQLSQEQKMKLADFLIENNGTPAELKKKANELLSKLTD